MLTPMDILKDAIKLILPNSDEKTRDGFLVNVVNDYRYCKKCDRDYLTDSKHCSNCDLEFL